MPGSGPAGTTDAEIKKIQNTLHPDRPPCIVVTDGAQIPRERSLFVAWWVAIIAAVLVLFVLATIPWHQFDLTGVPPDALAALDRGEAPARLGGIKLAEPVRVEVKRAGSRWRIVDAGNIYDLRRPRETYLFDLDLELAAALDQEEVTGALRERFEEERHTFPPGIQVQVDQPGARWTIGDADTLYTIQKKDQALEVYGETLGVYGHPYRRSLFSVFDGAEMTLRITIVSIACALMVGLLAGLGRASRNSILNGIASLYVEVIRGIPLLVQLFWIYYALAAIVKLPSFWSAVIGLTVCYGAYIGEIFRAGIQSISKGQWEAARSLGMSGGQAMRHVILPQAIRVVLPPIGNEFIALLKDSSLVSVLAISDLLRRGREFVSVNFTSFQTYTTVALIYLLMTLAFSRVVFYIEKGMAIEDKEEGPVSFMHRLAAHGADFVILYVLWMLLHSVVEMVINGVVTSLAATQAAAFALIPAATWNYGATGTLGGFPVPLWTSLGLALACYVAYMLIFWSRTGQTPGKMAVGLRIIGPDGQRPGLRRALLRLGPFLAVVVPVAIWRLVWGSQLTPNITSPYLIPWTGYLWFVVPVVALVAFALAERDRYGQGWHDKLAGTYVVRAT